MLYGFFSVATTAMLSTLALLLSTYCCTDSDTAPSATPQRLVLLLAEDDEMEGCVCWGGTRGVVDIGYLCDGGDVGVGLGDAGEAGFASSVSRHGVIIHRSESLLSDLSFGGACELESEHSSCT